MTLKITTIGGGSGQPPIIIGICKLLHDLDIEFNSIVGTWDSGGSSGQLRDLYGIMPPGDILKTIMAYVPPENRAISNALLRRFDKSYPELYNHNSGNLLLASMQQQCGIIPSIRSLEKTLDTIGKTYPITDCETSLHAEMQRVKAITVDKESEIDERLDANYKITKLWLEPEIKTILPKDILESTDVLIISPGSIFTSIIPHFTIKEVKQLCKRIKTRILITNLVDKHFDTDEYINSICGWMDLEPTHVIFNSIKCENDRYAIDNYKSINIDKDKIINGIPCISRPILKRDKKLFRHDPKRTGAAIMEILSKEGII
jgi:uncharacterized cofD-like protein